MQVHDQALLQVSMGMMDNVDLDPEAMLARKQTAKIEAFKESVDAHGDNESRV